MKNYLSRDFFGLTKQFKRKMRTTCLMLLVFVSSLFATNVNSQIARVNIAIKNAPIIQVIRTIESQTDYLFVFDKNEIDLTRKVDVVAEDKPVAEVLSGVFTDSNVIYAIEGTNIVLMQKNAASQQKSISGKVTDSSGQPLPGVSVVVKGSVNGNITDTDGNYSLTNVPFDAVLVFSFVGMKTQEISVSGRISINVKLEEETVGIEEVVAIGYGTKSKQTLTGAISVIDNKAIEGRIATQTTDLLQGISSGIQVTRYNTGNIRNSNNGITIRGVTSRNAPGVLVVVDGIAQASTDASALDNINPNDIESISVLKDGQAAIYGARAAGGVILITTKQGKSDKPVINATINYTIQRPSLMREVCNYLNMGEMQNEAYVNDGQVKNFWSPFTDHIKANNITFDDIKKNDDKYYMTVPWAAPYYLAHIDWADLMFDPSLMQEYNVSVSGKKDKMTYYKSVSYMDQDGMLAYGKNYNKRLLVTLKNDFNVTNFLKIVTNFKIGNQKVVEPFNYSSTATTGRDQTTTYGTYNLGVQGALFYVWPTIRPFTKTGHFASGVAQPMGYALAGGNTTDLNYIINGSVGAEITPVKNLLIYAGVASNYDITETDWSDLSFKTYRYTDEVFASSTNSGINRAGAMFYRNRYTTANAYAKYSFTGLKDHKIDLMAGYSHEEDDYRQFSTYRKFGLISIDLPTMGMGSASEQYNSESKSDYALNSAFSRLEYSYKDKYLFEGIFRYDGSSKFAEGHRWAPFWGFSGGWVITEEGFMKNVKKVVDFMKIRASWGQLGNQSGIDFYDYVSQVSVSGSYPMGSWTAPSAVQRAALGGMASLTRSWEIIESKNLGLDFTAFNSRLNGVLEYYIKDNKDMFFNQEFPQVLGTVAPSINGAHVQTKGWEVELGWRDKIRDFGYSVKVNLSDNNTEVIKLADSAIPSQGLNSFVEGNPYNSYYGLSFDGFIKTDAELTEYKSKFTGGIPNNLKLGDAKYKDLDNDGILEKMAYTVGEDGKPTSTSGDLVRIGDAGQHYLFGVTLGFNWKNFDFSSFLQGVVNWNVINTIKPVNEFYEPVESYFYHQTWAQDRPDAMFPRVSQDYNIKSYNYQCSDAPYYFWNNRYIRLKNIQLGYTIPQSITRRYKIDKLRVYFNGTDIWESSNLPGKQDPETPFQLRYSPFPRQYSFGLNLTF